MNYQEAEAVILAAFALADDEQHANQAAYLRSGKPILRGGIAMHNWQENGVP